MDVCAKSHGRTHLQRKWWFDAKKVMVWCEESRLGCAVTQGMSHIHDSLLCVTWLMGMCDMIHWYKCLTHMDRLSFRRSCSNSAIPNISILSIRVTHSEHVDMSTEHVDMSMCVRHLYQCWHVNRTCWTCWPVNMLTQHVTHFGASMGSFKCVSWHIRKIWQIWGVGSGVCPRNLPASHDYVCHISSSLIYVSLNNRIYICDVLNTLQHTATHYMYINTYMHICAKNKCEHNHWRQYVLMYILSIRAH